MVQYVLQLADVAGRIAFEPPADSGAQEAIKRELRKCRDKHLGSSTRNYIAGVAEK